MKRWLSLFIRNYNSFGFVLRNSTAGTLSLGAIVPTTGTYLMWLKLADDGTNLTLSWSYDGTNYTSVLTQPRITQWMRLKQWLGTRFITR